MSPLLLFVSFAALGVLVSVLTELLKRALGLRGNVLQTLAALVALLLAGLWVGLLRWGWEYLPLVWGGVFGASVAVHEVGTDRNPRNSAVRPCPDVAENEQ